MDNEMLGAIGALSGLLATHISAFGFGYVVASRAWRKAIEQSLEKRLNDLERGIKGGDENGK